MRCASRATSVKLLAAQAGDADDLDPSLGRAELYRRTMNVGTAHLAATVNTLVFAYDENQTQSGFRFWQDLNTDGRAQSSELGRVQDGNLTSIDFWVYRDPTDSTLWLVPEFAGTRMRLYSTSPVADLTSIDFAPASGYARSMIQAVPGYAYVFEIVALLAQRRQEGDRSEEGGAHQGERLPPLGVEFHLAHRFLLGGGGMWSFSPAL